MFVLILLTVIRIFVIFVIITVDWFLAKIIKITVVNSVFFITDDRFVITDNGICNRIQWVILAGVSLQVPRDHHSRCPTRGHQCIKHTYHVALCWNLKLVTVPVPPRAASRLPTSKVGLGSSMHHLTEHRYRYQRLALDHRIWPITSLWIDTDNRYLDANQCRYPASSLCLIFHVLPFGAIAWHLCITELASYLVCVNNVVLQL